MARHDSLYRRERRMQGSMRNRDEKKEWKSNQRQPRWGGHMWRDKKMVVVGHLKNLAMSHGLQDRSSPTRDWVWVLCSGNAKVLTTREFPKDRQEFPKELLKVGKYHCCILHSHFHKGCPHKGLLWMGFFVFGV